MHFIIHLLHIFTHTLIFRPIIAFNDNHSCRVCITPSSQGS